MSKKSKILKTKTEKLTEPVIITDKTQFRVMLDILDKELQVAPILCDDIDSCADYTDAILRALAAFATIEQLELCFNMMRVTTGLNHFAKTSDLSFVRKTVKTELEYRKLVLIGISTSYSVHDWKLFHQILAASKTFDEIEA